MALTTAASAHISAGDNLSLVAGSSQNWTALKNLVGLAGGTVSFFAQKLGIKLIANQGKVNIHAQTDSMTLAAMKDLTITSSAGMVTIAGKSVLLAAGGGYLKIHPSGEVEIGSPVKFTIRAPMASEGPASLDVNLPEFAGLMNYDIQFVFKDDEGQPYKNYKYVAWKESGETIEGVTDDKGQTQVFYSPDPEEYVVRLKFNQG